MKYIENKFISLQQNGNVKLIIGLFYRPPTQNKDYFIRNVNLMIACMPRDIPIIICGDFNENIEILNENVQMVNKKNNKENSIHFTMINSGFIECISECTTDKGTLIDHIYINRIKGWKSYVHDIYFSDHDLTILECGKSIFKELLK